MNTAQTQHTTMTARGVNVKATKRGGGVRRASVAKAATPQGSTLGERIQLMLEKRGMSQRAVAKLAGMSQQSLNYLTNPNLGVPAEKKTDRIIELASALQCDPVWLATGKSQPFGTSGGPNQVPLLDTRDIAAYLELSGKGRRDDLLRSGLLDKTAHVDVKFGPRAFAVEMWDEAFVPVLRPGDRVIVCPDAPPSTNEPVMACIKDTGEFVVRLYKVAQVSKGHDVFRLVPRNDNYPTIDSSSTKVEIVGSVIEAHIYRSRRAQFTR